MKALRQFFVHRFARPASVKSYLVGVILGGLGPLLVFSVVMMVLFTRQEQANRRRGLQDTARALSLAIDQEINASITHLESLATSEPLDAGAVNDFLRVAARILRIQEGWKSIVLFDPSGRGVVSVRDALAKTSASMSRDRLKELLRTRRPVISDFPGGDGAAQQIHVYVPVIREGKIIYVLAAVIEPQIFTDILLRQKIPSHWVATLFDSRQIVIARSRDAARHVGHSVEPLLGKIDSRRSEAFLSVQRQNEVSVYAAVNRSPLSGWSLALIVPRSEIDAILRRSLGAIVAGGLFLLVIGVGVALLFARQVSRSVAGLSSAAHALGCGQLTTAAVDTPIAELNDLAREMERAAALLQERESQRDRVEAALREQEEFLKRQADLLNLANEAIFAWDQDGTIIFWNRGAEQLYGFTQGEAIGQAHDRLLLTETVPALESLRFALAAHGEWSGELQQKAKNGRRIVVESRIKMIRDRAGRCIALECARDVTSRKRAAQRLAMEQAVTRALAESQNLDEAAQNILQAIAQGMSWEAGIFWEASQATGTLRGLAWWQAGGHGFAPFIENKRRQIFAKGVGLPGGVWAGEQPIWIANLAEDGQDAGRPSAIEFGLHSAFGFPIMLHREVFGVIEFFGRSVREEDADWLRVAQGIGSEIGQFVERLRAEEALRSSEMRLRNQAQELEEQLLASGRLVAVGELTASMAHEFNNPLGIILGFAQGLLASMNASDANYRHVEIIAEEAKRCEKLVQELLEFGRPRKGEFAFIDITGVIGKTMELVQSRAHAGHVETAVEVAPDLPRIHADAQQLQQVLLNLGLNAIDAMPKGGKLTVRARREGDSAIRLTVVDTGHGIDPDALRKIFQPFFTAKKKRGLGLGLSICDRIVKAHGGTLSASSAPGKGTTFTLCLPIAAEPAAMEPVNRPIAPV